MSPQPSGDNTMSKQFFFVQVAPALFAGELSAKINLARLDFVESPCKPSFAKNNTYQPIYIAFDYKDVPSDEITLAEYNELFYEMFRKNHGHDDAKQLIEKLGQVSEGLFIVGANYDSNYDSTTVIMIDDQQSFHFTRLFKICDQFGDSFAHSFDQQCISPMKAMMLMATNSY